MVVVRARCILLDSEGFRSYIFMLVKANPLDNPMHGVGTTILHSLEQTKLNITLESQVHPYFGKPMIGNLGPRLGLHHVHLDDLENMYRYIMMLV